MQMFDSPFGKIALTEERKRHIIAFHPDVAPHMRFIATTLAAPDETAPSVHDMSVIICYRLIKSRKLFLSVVVKTGSRPFIVTAYLAKKPKRSIL